MSLKDEIKRDTERVFLNMDDFGEIHIIDGLDVPSVIDDERLQERQSSNELDVSESSLIIFAPEKFIKRKVKGDKMMVDGKIYVVDAVSLNIGMYELALSRLESY